MTRSGFGFLALWLLGSSVVHAAEPPASAEPAAADVAAKAREMDKREIGEAVQSYAAAIRAKTGLADLFTEDGELINPGLDPLVGPEAIRSFLAPLASRVRIEEATMTPRAIDLYGDEAYVWGDYSQRVAVGERPLSTFAGRFVAQWHRADGRWKVRRMMVQPAPAAAP